MKIAVPTNDGTNVSGHFGRCRQFLIFEVGKDKVNLTETRDNAGCHDHGNGAEPQTHSGFVEVLRDCEVVLCGGIGAGAAQSLQSGGISVVQVEADSSAEQAVEAYRSGTLRPSYAGMCKCQH